MKWYYGTFESYNLSYREKTVILTPECSKTMQVIRCIFDVSMSVIVVLHRVHNNRLKPSPAHRYDEWVISLQFTLIPSMML